MHGGLNDWFVNWFDTPYYHTLYNKRNEEEASQFLNKLLEELNPNPTANFLDLACGKGRHSIYLNAKGFKVCGVDLSANSIHAAQAYSNFKLTFSVHDMREPFKNRAFDFVLNLFTSFGYFSDPEEDCMVIKSVKHCLKPGGVFVLDYFNASKPNLNFDKPFTKVMDGIEFNIFKTIRGDKIIKEIEVNDQGKIYHYSEQVRLYSHNQLKQILEEEGLVLQKTFGSYSLDTYDAMTSDRLILIAKKN